MTETKQHETGYFRRVINSESARKGAAAAAAGILIAAISEALWPTGS